MQSFIILHNNEDNEPILHCMEDTTGSLHETEMLKRYLDDIFDLEEGSTERTVCSSMMNDRFFGIALVEEGDLEFTYYTSLSQLEI